MLWYLIKFFCVFWQPYGHSLGFFSENAVNFPPSPAHTDILTCALWVWWSAFLSMFLDFYVDFCAFGDFLLLPPLEMCLWYLMECLRLSLHSSGLAGLAGPLCGGGAWMPLMLGVEQLWVQAMGGEDDGTRAFPTPPFSVSSWASWLTAESTVPKHPPSPACETHLPVP